MTTMFDAAALRDTFRLSNMVRSQQARWCADFPGAPPDTCRYCERHWKRYVGSRLDGHAACIVTEDFKQHVKELLMSSPTMTYAVVAQAIGMTEAVVRSWTYPIRNTRNVR